MSLPAGAHIIPISQPLIIDSEHGKLPAIAAALAGNTMYYLISGGQLELAGPPKWLSETEIAGTFMGSITTRSKN
jgi:hypothetical protein